LANPDFCDLLQAFNAAGVEYLIVGAHAVMIYTEPRYTKDIDLWVRPSAANAERVFRALAEFGAPLGNATPADFTNLDLVFQIGVAPNRIDILMDIAGVTFDEAWAGRTLSSYAGTPTQFLGKEHLIRAKKAAGRPHDLRDLEWLEASSDS
jgi:hypothetical protein